MALLVSARPALRRSMICGAAVVLALSVAGCGSQEPAETGTPPSSGGSPSATTSAGGFCDNVAGIEDDLALADLTADWKSDPQGYVDGLAAAADRFSSVDAPETIATSWEALSEFFTMTDTALDGVDATDPEAIEDALRSDDESAFAMVLLLPGQAETVGAFVQEECGVDLGIATPAIADVCDAMDPAHLESVFGATVPSGENRRWGQGVVECVWDDRDGTEVGIVVGPVDVVRPDLLQGQEPIDAVQGGDSSIDVYDGALGPLRAASGRTAATDVNGTAVLASVRTGDMDADALKAIALVGLIADELG